MVSDEVERLTLDGLPFTKQGSRWPYRITLDNELMNLALDSCIPSPNSPSILVQIKSAFIWKEGISNAYQKVIDLMKWIYGDDLEGEKISRVDLFADLQWSGRFKETDIQRFITRAREKITYHDGKRITGYKIGKGQLSARIYDKTLEARKSGKEWLYKLWGLSAASRPKVWRVEAQFRRDSLKRFGVETFDDLVNACPEMWAYAVGKWLTMREGNQRNVSRRPVTDFWQHVQAVEMNLQGDGPRLERMPRRKSGLTDESATNIMAGLIKRVALNHGMKSSKEALEMLLPSVEAKLIELDGFA